MTLEVDKMNGHGLRNKAHCERLLKKTKLSPHQLQIHKPTLITRWSTAVIKVRGYMHSNAFKTRLGFSFTVISSFSLKGHCVGIVYSSEAIQVYFVITKCKLSDNICVIIRYTVKNNSK